MRRALLTIALALAFIFGYAVAGSMADEIMAKTEGKSGACNLVGASVKDSQGEFLGSSPVSSKSRTGGLPLPS